MQKIIDLDAAGVIAVPKTVRIAGVEYRLPGDIPATLYALLLELQASPDAETPELVGALLDEMLAAFQVFQPEMTRLPLGIRELTGAIGVIYNPAEDDSEDIIDGEAETVDPTPTPTVTEAPARPKRSRSSTS